MKALVTKQIIPGQLELDPLGELGRQDKVCLRITPTRGATQRWLSRLSVKLSFFFKDFIYLFMRDRETEREAETQAEKQAPCREPDTGLDSRTPGSLPGLKAGAKSPSHLGIHLGIPEHQALGF